MCPWYPVYPVHPWSLRCGGLSRTARAGAGAALVALLALTPGPRGAAHAGDAAPPRPGPPAAKELTAREIAAVKHVLRRLAAAMAKGDASELEELLSPTLSADERNRTVSRARREFERFSYLHFEFDLKGELPIDRLGPDEIEVVSVPAEYEYEARTPSRDPMASTGPNSFRFRLARTGGEWRIVSSDIFDQFTAWGVERALGLIFLGGFALVLAVFLWGWMALDAWMRFGRGYALLVLLSTPLGAGAYFFAVYLRRRFLPKRKV